MSERKSFVVQCKNFFGLKPGQSLAQFSAELKQLTVDDKADLSMMLEKEGFPVLTQ